MSTVVSVTISFLVKEGTYDENCLSAPWKSVCMKGAYKDLGFTSDLKPPVIFQILLDIMKILTDKGHIKSLGSSFRQLCFIKQAVISNSSK